MRGDARINDEAKEARVAKEWGSLERDGAGWGDNVSITPREGHRDRPTTIVGMRGEHGTREQKMEQEANGTSPGMVGEVADADKRGSRMAHPEEGKEGGHGSDGICHADEGKDLGSRVARSNGGMEVAGRADKAKEGDSGDLMDLIDEDQEVRMAESMCVRMHAYVRVCMHTCMHLNKMRACIHACMYACICTQVHVLHACVHTIIRRHVCESNPGAIGNSNVSSACSERRVRQGGRWSGGCIGPTE